MGAVEPLENDLEGDPARGLGLVLPVWEEDDSVDSRFNQDDDLLVPFALKSNETGRSCTMGCFSNDTLVNCLCSSLSTPEPSSAVCGDIYLLVLCTVEDEAEFGPDMDPSVWDSGVDDSDRGIT